MPTKSDKKPDKASIASKPEKKKADEAKKKPAQVTAKSEKAEKKVDAQALKADEILGWWGFLSWLGFKKEDKPKQTKEEKIEEEAQKESIVLEKPKHAPMSFDVAQPKASKADFFWDRIKVASKPAPQSSSSKPKPFKPYHVPQRGDVPHKQFAKWGPGWYKAQSHPVHAPVHVAPRVHKAATTSANLVKKTEIFIDDKITVKEFSEKMWIPLPELMKKLIQNKIMTSITASLDFDTAALIASEFDISVKKNENKLGVETFMSGDLQAILDLDKGSENLQSRPPIVTVMGHVDHGKTSLLDYLRKTVVAEGEAWWITQSIWASVVEHDGHKICFIDTPGHELFTNLRARWAKLTNIAVIVVAADDSVMPQTIESIGHAKEAGVPIIVAITKIDKPGKKMEQIQSDLAAHGLTPEERGGNVPMIGISSKTGKGIPELLDAIILQSEMLDLKYNPDRWAVGVILDAYKDPKQGVVSTIIVMTGTLKVGDIVVAYSTYGKIRRMQNWKGQTILKATGWDPVQVLGITDLPEPWRILEVVKNEKEAHDKISLIQDQIIKQSGSSAVKQFITEMQSGSIHSELKLILKSDGSSSLEALKQAVNGLQLPKNVTIKIVHSDVGYFSDSDLSLAQASGALLLGYNISMNALLKKKSDSMKIEMKNFDIIYELTDYLSKLLLGMVEIEQHEVVIAKVEVLAIFFTKNKDMTVGGRILSGKLKSKVKFRVLRGEDILCTGDLLSLHKNKDEIKSAGEGEEVGLKVTTGKRIEIGDSMEFYEMQDIIE